MLLSNTINTTAVPLQYHRIFLSHHINIIYLEHYRPPILTLFYDLRFTKNTRVIFPPINSEPKIIIIVLNYAGQHYKYTRTATVVLLSKYYLIISFGSILCGEIVT